MPIRTCGATARRSTSSCSSASSWQMGSRRPSDPRRTFQSSSSSRERPPSSSSLMMPTRTWGCSHASSQEQCSSCARARHCVCTRTARRCSSERRLRMATPARKQTHLRPVFPAECQRNVESKLHRSIAHVKHHHFVNSWGHKCTNAATNAFQMRLSWRRATSQAVSNHCRLILAHTAAVAGRHLFTPSLCARGSVICRPTRAPWSNSCIRSLSRVASCRFVQNVVPSECLAASVRFRRCHLMP
mmetsp:Transcript_26668/g.77911  ORF Transcript_26668/g.77911 Transcript_26668/m.77911 type:complete len:244 (+) Transcript_26668:273-1004(+)